MRNRRGAHLRFRVLQTVLRQLSIAEERAGELDPFPESPPDLGVLNLRGGLVDEGHEVEGRHRCL